MRSVVRWGYRWHESRRAEFGFGGVRLDDDNRRRWINAEFSQRIVNAPRHKLSAELAAYTSRNSEQGAVYFNPERDRELTAGMLHEWRIMRRHDRHLIQRTGITAGTYFQQDFGSDALWRLQWEQEWQLSPALLFSYGASYGRRPYDGEMERQVSYFLHLGARL